MQHRLGASLDVIAVIALIVPWWQSDLAAPDPEGNRWSFGTYRSPDCLHEAGWQPSSDSYKTPPPPLRQSQ